jgi:hypothetical protein
MMGIAGLNPSHGLWSGVDRVPVCRVGFSPPEGGASGGLKPTLRLSAASRPSLYCPSAGRFSSGLSVGQVPAPVLLADFAHKLTVFGVFDRQKHLEKLGAELLLGPVRLLQGTQGGEPVGG